MSRIIVKGLPKYLTEDRLRDHFSQKGHITDVKLMKKRNGESRRFAFLGFKSDQEAQEVARFFNKSFIDTSRIEVDVAKSFSDPTVPLPVKEMKRRQEEKLKREEERLLQSELKENERKKRKKNQKSQLDMDIESNPALKEFMEVMKPAHQQRATASDDLVSRSEQPGIEELNRALEENGMGGIRANSPPSGNMRAAIAENESDDEYENFGKGIDPSNKKTSTEEEEMIPLNDVGDRDIAADEEISDFDWLKMRRRRMKDNGEIPDQQGNDKVESEEIGTSLGDQSKQNFSDERSPSPEPLESEPIQKISETGRLFVRNISYEATEDDFRKLFAPFGQLKEVHLAIDTRTNKSKGFLYVQFSKSDDAVQAFKSLDKYIFEGRLLHILPAEKKKDHRLDEFDLKNMPLKKQRELKRRDQAAKSQFSWNSLYMNNDAILESTAKQLGITKSQLIDPQNSSSGVKQALAEAHVIGDVRKYFELKGVDLIQFDKKEKDDKIILVKNFTYGTTSEEIGDLFSQYGKLVRILMPPAGTIAIVEFQDAPSARAAFTKLSYRRFKKSILYLEKGPKDLFPKAPEEADTHDIKTEQNTSIVNPKATTTDLLEDLSDDQEPEFSGPTVSVFVKNLSFNTTSHQLENLFKPIAGFVVALVKTRPNSKEPNKPLSMGFGFAEFKSKEQAEAAINILNGHVLEGHKLQLKISHRQKTVNAQPKSTKGKSNKLIVKNLPFEATRKDVFDLFNAFGQLKSVRVPKKFDKSARGFAFVEFILASEAASAVDQLQGVHLLGRKLVVQYAEQETDDPEMEIARMTERVRKQVGARELAATRLAGKGKIELEEKEEEY